MNAKKISKIFFIYLLITIVGALFIVPLLWMLTTSFSTPQEAAAPGIRLFPSQFRWSNYTNALTIMPFGLYALNTIKVTFIALVGSVLSSAMAAYAFARLRAPGKNALFALMLSTIMLPMMVTMIPSFIIFKSLGWYDTLLPLFVPAWFGNAFYIFLMRQFFFDNTS